MFYDHYLAHLLDTGLIANLDEDPTEAADLSALTAMFDYIDSKLDVPLTAAEKSNFDMDLIHILDESEAIDRLKKWRYTCSYPDCS